MSCRRNPRQIASSARTPFSVGSPYDFSRTSDHIERAIQSTDAWLAQNGLEQSGIPEEMRPHRH